MEAPGRQELYSLDTRQAASEAYNALLSAGYQTYDTSNTNVWVAMGQDDAVWADFGHGMPGAITWCDPNYSCTTLLRADANVDGPNHPNECSAADKASCLTNFYGVVPCAPGVYGPCFGSYLGHYRLMAFVGCQTGASATSGSNLVDEAVDTMGVGSAIGFKQEITYGGPASGRSSTTPWRHGRAGSSAAWRTMIHFRSTGDGAL